MMKLEDEKLIEFIKVLVAKGKNTTIIFSLVKSYTNKKSQELEELIMSIKNPALDTKKEALKTTSRNSLLDSHSPLKR